MIDWVTISLALVIIATLVGIFGFMAWKINMSDPLITGNLTGKKDDSNQLLDSDRKKKDKYGNDQSKKKRKEQKKSKRENKEEDQQRHTVKFKEPSTQTSEETDNEREESEQESSTPQVVEAAPKVRHRNKKKARPTASPPPSSAYSSDHTEGILINKDEKSPVTNRPEPVPHPKLAYIKPKDEVELARQHQQQAKNQGKSTQGSNKQTGPTSSSASSTSAPVKKSAPASINANQGGQKQQQQQQILQEQQEQPFTTVGGNRHKAGTPPSQQQNKSANVPPPSTTTTTAAAVAAPVVPAPVPQQQVPVQNQHEQLPQRSAPSRQQKEPPPAQQNGFKANTQPAKQPVVASAVPPTKFSDLVKALPTSQAVVTELMSALDAFPLSSDELELIMLKIANKQSVLKQDWSKLQHGQKVDPQAHIGQVMDESARAYEEDMKTNAMIRIKELTNELNNDKRRISELIKETSDKDLNIQMLHAQLSTIQHPQQQMQTFQAEYKRLSEENLQLKQRLAQQQQHFQQQHQQLSSMNLVPNNNADPANAQLRVISDQIKKLSVDNGNLEKQLQVKDAALKEHQKQYKLNEDKLLKELNETRTLNNNQINELKRRIEQLEKEKEQLRRIEIAPVEPTPVINNQDREKLEQLIKENEQYKIKLNDTQNQENQLRQEIDQLKIKSEQDKILNNQLAAANAQLDTLRAELELAKANNDKVRLRNWKVMNELKSAEEKLAAITRSNPIPQSEN